MTEPLRGEWPGRDLPDLADLCRIYDVGLELIERSHDLDGLLDAVLDEYERRLSDLPGDALDDRAGPPSGESARKLRGLVMFAGQAAALKAKAGLAVEVRERAAALEAANARLSIALGQAERARGRLDGVVAALSAGILILGRDGNVQHASGPAAECLGAAEAAALVGRPIPDVIAGVTRDQEVEISVTHSGRRRVLLVERRAIAGAADDEVVLITDVTRRVEEIEERHRLEKLAEILRTLSVLSHKINNPLTSLLGRAQLLRARNGFDPQVAKAAEVIEESAFRIADLIRELAHVVKEGRQEAVEQLLDMSGLQEGQKVTS